VCDLYSVLTAFTLLIKSLRGLLQSTVSRHLASHSLAGLSNKFGHHIRAHTVCTGRKAGWRRSKSKFDFVQHNVKETFTKSCFFMLKLLRASSVGVSSTLTSDHILSQLNTVHTVTHSFFKMKRQNYSCDRPRKPIGLWDVEAPTFSRESAHR
jgi:hypothetical protein